jgi:hypothetical protein
MELEPLNKLRLDALKLRIEHMKKQTFKQWEPKEGECLAGEFLGIGSFEHYKYGTQFVMKIRDDNDIFWDVYLSDWLKKELKKLDALSGDYVAVLFKEMVTPKRGFPYKSYSVEIDKS